MVLSGIKNQDGGHFPLGFERPRRPWDELILTVMNVPLLLGEKSLSFRFSHQFRCLLHEYFPFLHHCQSGQLPWLTDKCVSCGRSYFGVVGENDASVVPRRELEEKRPLSSASEPGVKTRDCASPGWDASKRGYTVWEIRDGRAWKWKCWLNYSLLRPRLHKRSFKSTRLNDFVTVFKSTRKQSVYTKTIFRFRCCYVMAVIFWTRFYSTL